MLFYLYFYNILFSGKTSPYMLGYVLHFNIHSMYFMIQWLFHRLGHFCQIENTCTTRERETSVKVPFEYSCSGKRVNNQINLPSQSEQNIFWESVDFKLKLVSSLNDIRVIITIL